MTLRDVRRLAFSGALMLSFVACADLIGLQAPKEGDLGPDGMGGGSGGAHASGGDNASGGDDGAGGTSASGGASSGGETSSGGDSSSGGAGTGGVGTGGAGSGGAGTGGAGTGGAGTGGAGTGGGGSGEFTMTTTAWTSGDPIPEGHTCADPQSRGQNGWGAAPDLMIANPPEGTMSYAFFMIDITLADQGNVNGNHSGAWNIPTTITSLAEGWGLADLDGAAGINGGYLGPCPNMSAATSNNDTYHLILLAMPEASYTGTGTGTAGVRDTYADLKAQALEEIFIEGTSDAVN